MEGVPPSFMDDDVNQLDFQVLEDTFNMSELPSYVILMHILSEDDCLQLFFLQLSLL